jgi:hypothetical protein
MPLVCAVFGNVAPCLVALLPQEEAEEVRPGECAADRPTELLRSNAQLACHCAELEVRDVPSLGVVRHVRDSDRDPLMDSFEDHVSPCPVLNETELSDVPPERWTLPRALARILSWAMVGASAGFLVGALMFSYKCVVAANGIWRCHPRQELKIGLVTVAGLVLGLLASRLYRSLTSDRQRSVMAAATITLLVVLVVVWTGRNDWWNCPDLCSPYAT